MKLELPDSHHLEAAAGWLELGNWREANEEIEQVFPAGKVHPDVLDLRCKIYTAAQKWDYVIEVARTICRLQTTVPDGALHLAGALRKLDRISEAHEVLERVADDFPKDWRICFELACCCCRLGDKRKALWWLENAIDTAGVLDIRMKALDEPDLETLWRDIAKI